MQRCSAEPLHAYNMHGPDTLKAKTTANGSRRKCLSLLPTCSTLLRLCKSISSALQNHMQPTRCNTSLPHTPHLCSSGCVCCMLISLPFFFSEIFFWIDLSIMVVISYLTRGGFCGVFLVRDKILDFRCIL